MNHLSRLVGAIAVLVFSAATAQSQSKLDVQFEWSKQRHYCNTVSPPFKIGGIPEGTKKLKFHMVDLDYTIYQHGGGTIEYKGSGDIPERAFYYLGPCSRRGPHRYEFSVEALDDSGKVLARGAAMRKMP